jgi:choice-of-anchor B domain-containing protein
MKIKLCSIAAMLVINAACFAQNLNVTLRSHLTYSGQTCANICGYVDQTGKEYALVGASIGLSIVDISNPSAPLQVYQHTGPTGNSSLWQEIKVRGNYAYVTTEAGGGLQIFNLSSLPNAAGITMVSWTGDGAIAGQLNTIHALHIDNNFVYLYGSNLFSGGAVVADITSPMNPNYVGHYSQGAGNAQYVHDGYVRNDTLYAGHIYQGYFSVVDFTNKANPIELATQNTPNNFTHNTWLSQNSKTLFTTDEVSNSFLTSYDISDLSNIKQLDKIQSNPGSGSIVHNVHIINVAGNDFAVTSWYHDGFTITDVGRPKNLVQVGDYDTYPTGGNGFDGAWGVYPFFPSGTIVVSNINEGLFVFTPNYVRACYLEGNITDSITGFPINNAFVQINTTATTEYSRINGDYATGIPSPGGTYSVTYSKPGYYTKTITGLVFSAGVVTLQDVQLSPLPPFNLYGTIIENGTGNPIANANVSVSNNSYSFNVITNANGDFVINNIYEENYQFIAGKWGYVTDCAQNLFITASTNTVVITLSKGIYDDFTFDFGWTVTSTATTGIWERGVPLGTDNNGTQANPGTDVTTDCDSRAFVTGNTGTTSSDDDVDNGATILVSPIFDPTNLVNPQLDFSYWFYTGGGSGTPNDSLSVYIHNGSTINRLFFANVNSTNNSTWVHKSIVLSSAIPITPTMRVYIRIADNAPGHIVEGGFDKFQVFEGSNGISNLSNNSNEGISVFPNPSYGKFFITIDRAIAQKTYEIKVYNLLGKEIFTSVHPSNEQNQTIDLSGNANGVYFIQLKTASGITTKKIIKNE